MLLRRITEHVKAQNWFAVGIDFVIVVVGVFIGIQVANWNDARAARAELDQQLISFRIELEENQVHFSEYRAEVVEQMNDVKTLRAAFKADAPSIGADEFNAKFLNIQRIKIFAPDLAALAELRETGGLRRLSGTDIRTAIADWERSLAEVGRKHDDSLRHRNEVLNLYMIQNIAYGPLLEQSYILGDDVGVSKFRNDVATLSASRELDNQLAYRYGIIGTTVFSLDELAQETAQLIDALKAREAAS